MSQIQQENYRYIDAKVALSRDPNCAISGAKEFISDFFYGLEGDTTPKLIKGMYEMSLESVGKHWSFLREFFIKNHSTGDHTILEIITYLLVHVDRYDPQAFCDVFIAPVKSTQQAVKKIKKASKGTKNSEYLSYVMTQLDQDKHPFVLYGTTSVKDGYFSFISVYIEPPYMKLTKRSGGGMRLNDIDNFKSKDGYTYKLYCYVQGRWEDNFDLFGTAPWRHEAVLIAPEHYAFGDKELAFNLAFDKSVLKSQFKPKRKGASYLDKRVPLNELAICHVPLHLLSDNDI